MHTVGTLAVTNEIKQDSASGHCVMNLKCYIPLAQTFCVESEQEAIIQLHLDLSLAKKISDLSADPWLISGMCSYIMGEKKGWKRHKHVCRVKSVLTRGLHNCLL